MTVSRERLLAVGLALAAALAVWILWPRAPEDPEEVIRQKVIQMARAAEKKDVGFVLDQLSESFRSADGLSKQEMKGFIAAQILRGSWVRVFVVDTRVSAAGSTAEFQGKFVFGRSDAKELQNLTKESVMGSYRVEGKLTRESDGQWRFVSASWREEGVL